MHQTHEREVIQNRRTFLGRASVGIGSIALASLLEGEVARS